MTTPKAQTRRVWILLSPKGIPMYGFMEATRGFAEYRAAQSLRSEIYIPSWRDLEAEGWSVVRAALKLRSEK